MINTAKDMLIRCFRRRFSAIWIIFIEFLKWMV